MTRKLLAVLGVVYALTMAGIVLVALRGTGGVDRVAGPVMVVYGAIAVGFGVRAAHDHAHDRRTRRAWTLISVAFVPAAATPALFFFVTGARPFPQPGDGAHLCFVVLLFVALQQFPVRAATRRERAKAVLDSATVAVGAMMVLWYLVIGPALDTERASVRLILAAAAYPVADLLVLFATARVLLLGTAGTDRRPLALLGIGVLALFAGDAYLGYSQAHVSEVQRTPWQFACWLTMHFMLACSAVEKRRRAGDSTTGTAGSQHALAGKLPYAGIAVGYALMAVAAIRELRLYPWAGLVLGGMGLTGLALLRQLLAQRDTADAAGIDALTGLVNRARLHQSLTRALDRAGRNGHGVGVLLIDLNGFKQINDTLGHQAGDAVLTAAAEAVRRCLRGDDLAGRLGGDEFAVVLPGVPGEREAVAVARRITAALAEPVLVDGSALQTSASIGVAVVTGPGTCTADEALHRADVAMYAAKRRGDAVEQWCPGPAAEPGVHEGRHGRPRVSGGGHRPVA
ncbi:GGDEF domain-containing protein [Actinoplanes sp. N902-109]|uniref:GGDEF domain-containing protein n=1 Tax=Actinoplanes sp. (strain N902-109) TaxID=649831 RepID=UPI0003294446|nr:GGDEF domain-containing protein [Actinoplanes sp. N902-109]AGL17101.1 diguanylate cyclase/phosphodiesterase [Actinoplanes sp. N902-109]